MTYLQPLDVEGLALNGFVKEAELADCESKSVRKSRLRVKLVDGRLLETECLPYERIVRSYLVVLKYLEFGKAISSKDISEFTARVSDFDISE
ncbi:MAG: hypothetical protein RMI56_01720 [Sulfolobales archaeon]|nr:hypothetical protein [Sulfolobales archaeon]MDW8082495.1 hypothetical protein [Sulfolobales archaeon]